MQTVRYQQRVLDVEWGPGRVVEIIHSPNRGLNGAAYVEALVAFDDGVTRPICVEDLNPEQPDDRC